MSTSAMHVAKTGLTAQQYKMQVIANNLANVNTTGFKRDRANFESLFYQIVKTAGAQTADDTALTSPLAVGTGVKVVSTQKLFTQGGLVNTDNSLDLAIDGQGFFQALLPDGRVGYTRSGILSRNAEGVLTTTSGYVLQPQIQIPEDATSINISMQKSSSKEITCTSKINNFQIFLYTYFKNFISINCKCTFFSSSYNN